MKKSYLSGVLITLSMFASIYANAQTYCTPAFYYGTGYGYGCSDYMIVGNSSYPFSISGALGTSFSDPSNCTTSGYIDETTSAYTVTFIPGSSYNATIGANIYGYSMSSQMWIDFNLDGTFQTSESIGGKLWTGTTTPVTLNIPAAATAGSYRMRVIAQYNCCTGSGYAAYPSEYPCPTSSGSTMIYYGDARDYQITIAPPPTVLDSPTILNFDSVSVGLTSMSLSTTLSGMHLLSGGGTVTVTAPANYMVSLDGATWATSVNITYSDTAFGATSVYVNFTPSATGIDMDSLMITGGGLPVPAYVHVIGVGSSPTVTPAAYSAFFGTVGIGTYSSVSYVPLTAEFLNPLSSNLTVSYSSNFYSSTSGSSTYTIPYSGGSLSSTSIPVYFRPTSVMMYSGSLTITGGGLSSPVHIILSGAGGSPCSGTPTAGTASVLPESGDGSTSFTLSLSGYTLATGLTYQWQSASSPTGPWTSISGATDITYTFTGISSPTYYQCVVSCSGSTASSSPAEALYISCTPSASSWDGVFPSGSSSFSYTGGLQSFTIPAGVSSLSISATGAQGGNSSSYSGGHGAIMAGTFSVTSGHVLKILVGQQGLTGGGNAGGGGGGTFVWDSTAGNVLLIAAGGGGGGGYSSSAGAGLDAVTGINGTAGAGGYNGGGVSGYGGTVPTSLAGIHPGHRVVAVGILPAILDHILVVSQPVVFILFHQLHPVQAVLQVVQALAQAATAAAVALRLVAVL